MGYPGRLDPAVAYALMAALAGPPNPRKRFADRHDPSRAKRRAKNRMAAQSRRRNR